MSKKFVTLVESLNTESDALLEGIMNEFEESFDANKLVEELKQLDSLNEIQTVFDFMNRNIFPILGKIADKVESVLEKKPEKVKEMIDFLESVNDEDSQRAIKAKEDGDHLLFLVLYNEVKQKKEHGKSRKDSMGV
jgi:iron-sulfur cluster repair protein YtfE (RIC family)